jgi:hypothetical protein
MEADRSCRHHKRSIESQEWYGFVPPMGWMVRVTGEGSGLL